MQMRPQRLLTTALVALAVLAGPQRLRGQPSGVPGGVEFRYRGSAGSSVAVTGDFNSWSKVDHPMSRDSAGGWRVVVPLRPGVYQYKLLVDRTEYVLDPANPATIDNYNKSSRNSVFLLNEGGEVMFTATPASQTPNSRDVYTPRPERKPVFLNIIWHQHQPLYVNPETDQLSGPWVRTHATKDYYDMAAMVQQYPDIHCTFNLTSSLLVQLQEYYVARLGRFVDVRKNTVDARGFLKAWKGKTDPWIDLALRNVESYTTQDKDVLYRLPWNAFGISEVQLSRFPEYAALKHKRDSAGTPGDGLFSADELRQIKFWFYAAHFDPDFLRGPVELVDGSMCDLSDLVREDAGKFVLRRAVTEADCMRMVAESYKVMANVVRVHRALRYVPATGAGQMDVITTPYYHPILPLIYDSDLARICQPGDALPRRFSFPADAEAHVAKSVRLYEQLMGGPPSGMWPGEGSVAQEILPILSRNGVLYTASDARVLQRSTPPGRPNTTPYRFRAGDRDMVMVFRDTELSDRIGFKYQTYEAEEAAEDFVQALLSFAPPKDSPDVLITVILDGENAWEWYRKDMDGKDFLHALYRKLTRLHGLNLVITSTVSEYLAGNPRRGIPAHPPETLPLMERLWPGSWINGNYDTWIGEQEENSAWEYLLRVRNDLESSGVRPPVSGAPVPRKGSKGWYAYKAWESMYAAEGSDWFWWYGTDQGAPGGDAPFDAAFRTHLKNVYAFARRAGASMSEPDLPPLVSSGQSRGTGQGTMAHGGATLQDVTLVCDAGTTTVPGAIYVAGNHPALGDWKPNTVRMYDDGTHGDPISGDGKWTLVLQLPVGSRIEYKYTNSGLPGVWTPSEEFAGRNRSMTVLQQAGGMTVYDEFGR